MKIISRSEAIKQGLPRYFTGKPCKHGHVAERYVLNWTCVTCHGLKCAEYQPKWRAANPHKAAEYGEKYAEQHKLKNKEWRKKNQARCAETQRQWNAKNRKKRNELSKKWRSANHSVMIAHVKKRKLDKLNRTPAWLTDDDFWMMSEMYHLAEIRTKTTGIVWHVDHVIPLRGKTVSGFHVPSNLRVITAQENMKKETAMPLVKSTSKEAFRKNVKAEIAAGKPQKQAVAIAYATKRAAAAPKSTGKKK